MTRHIIGFRAIEEMLKSPPEGAVLLVDAHAGGKRVREISRTARSRGVQVQQTEAAELNRLVRSGEHRGAVLMVKENQGPGYQSLKDFFDAERSAEKSLLLFLDGITDPHNLGAILRSADLFQVDAVIIPGRRSAQVNETVMKVSSGAAKYVPVIGAGNLVQSIKEAQKESYWVYAADLDGSAPWEVPLKGRTGLVLGAEGKGVSRLVREVCDRLISIPCAGHIDSLNVSVAAGILLYEVSRQNAAG